MEAPGYRIFSVKTGKVLGKSTQVGDPGIGFQVHCPWWFANMQFPPSGVGQLLWFLSFRLCTVCSEAEVPRNRTYLLCSQLYSQDMITQPHRAGLWETSLAGNHMPNGNFYYFGLRGESILLGHLVNCHHTEQTILHKARHRPQASSEWFPAQVVVLETTWPSAQAPAQWSSPGPRTQEWALTELSVAEETAWHDNLTHQGVTHFWKIGTLHTFSGRHWKIHGESLGWRNWAREKVVRWGVVGNCRMAGGTTEIHSGGEVTGPWGGKDKLFGGSGWDAV